MSCTCQKCGRQFKVDFLVPDDVWEKMKPPGKPIGAGLLCGHCIVDYLESQGYGAWRPTMSNLAELKKVTTLLLGAIAEVEREPDLQTPRIILNERVKEMLRVCGEVVETTNHESRGQFLRELARWAGVDGPNDILRDLRFEPVKPGEVAKS
jgi:hypothetical protein